MVTYIWQEGYIATSPEILHGQPIVAGTRVPVRAIAEMWRMGDTPEMIAEQLDLPLARVFAALSYFCDHQQEIIAAIERNRLPTERDITDVGWRPNPVTPHRIKPRLAGLRATKPPHGG